LWAAGEHIDAESGGLHSRIEGSFSKQKFEQGVATFLQTEVRGGVALTIQVNEQDTFTHLGE